MNEVTQKSWQDFDIDEHSMSARIMDRVVGVFNPKAHDSFHRLMLLMRATDNAVDEGESFEFAKECVKSQWAYLGNPQELESKTDGFLVSELSQLLYDLPEASRPMFVHRYRGLLEYFHLDLVHRFYLKPYSQERLDKHRDNGFFQFFGAIKIILNGEDVDDNGKFRELINVWAKSEPIGDLDEDLRCGLVFFTDKEGAKWVKQLQVGEPVNQQEINEYIDEIKHELSCEMFRLAPAAFQEVGGIVGLLMTLDFIKRSIFLKTKKFEPDDKVIYGSGCFK